MESYRPIKSNNGSCDRSNGVVATNQSKQRTIEFCLVTCKDKFIFDGSPDVWLNFSWGNIGSTLTSDSANERCCLYAHSNNPALKRRTRIIYHIPYIYPLGNLFVWRTWCARVIVMRLRRDKLKTVEITEKWIFREASSSNFATLQSTSRNHSRKNSHT